MSVGRVLLLLKYQRTHLFVHKDKTIRNGRVVKSGCMAIAFEHTEMHKGPLDQKDRIKV